MMNRRAKIVCTLGPATAPRRRWPNSSTPEWMWRGSTSATAPKRSTRRSTPWSARSPPNAVAWSVCSRTCRARRSGWASFAAGPVVWATGERIVITTAECPGDHDRVSTTYEGLAGDVRPGDRLLVDDGKIDLRVLDVDGVDIRCEVARRRSGQRPQGHLASWGRRQRSALVGEGHRGSEVRPRARRRHGRHVLRAGSRGGQARARDHGRGWPAGARHRETREARGGFGPSGDRRGVRRPDGGTR